MSLNPSAESNFEALKTELTAQGQNQVQSPNIEKLAPADLTLQQQYDVELQSELSQQHTLEEALALVRSKQEQIFAGDLPPDLQRQRVYFDEVIFIRELAAAAPQKGWSHEQALEQLLDYFAVPVPTSETDLQRYAHAQRLYRQLGIDVTPAVKIELARKVLRDDDLARELNHQQLQANNQQQRRDYQNAYQDLLMSLEALRLNQQSHLTDDEWASFKAEKLAEFNLAFFD